MPFQVFAGAADEYGIISCTAFNRCFRELADPRSESDAEALSFLLTGLYDIFNSDKNGAVDFTELSSGLSVLCGGTRRPGPRSHYTTATATDR